MTHLIRETGYLHFMRANYVIWFMNQSCKTPTPKQIAYFYNTKLLTTAIQSWMVRGQGQDCSIWTINSKAYEVMNLRFQNLNQSETLGHLYLVNPFRF